MPAFETSEFRARLEGVRRLMGEAGMDALLVLSEPNIYYLTGYEGFSDYVPQAALITPGDDPYLLLREMDIACASPTCWIGEDRLVPYEERFIGSSERTPWEPIASFIAGKTRSKRIGVEFSAKGFGVKEHAALAGGLGVERFLDADGLVSKCKRVKSARELAYIAEAAEIVDRAMLAGIERIAPGVRECDVAATVMAALCSGTETIPGGPPRPPTMPVAPVATAPHLKWGDGAYAPGLQTNFEIGAFRHRYCCALSRTAYVGSPPPRLRQVHDAVQDGFLAAFEAIRPGAACGDVARAFSKAFTPHGVRKESRVGYSIGIDWNDGGASLQPDDASPIVRDMTLHLIIGIWEREDGYVFSETVRVTETGAVSYTKLPRQIFER